MSLPEQYGRYQIKRILGRGGMATVYLAHDPRFGRDVALKAIGTNYKDDVTFRSRFEREARTIAALEHPAIVPVYDFGEDNDQLYLVMRHMPNGTLNDRIVMGPMSGERAIPIIRRLADALDHAHQNGVIHRDLKPANILFDAHERAYLSDFGIVKLAAEGTDANLTGSGVIGTPSYMSPEQVHGDEVVDGRSDIYTLGLILFELLTARKPYRADTPVKQMMAHVMEPIPDILEIVPELPPACATVIQRALAKNKESRYQTAQDLTADLTTSLTGNEFVPIPRPIIKIDPVDRGAETVTTDPDTVSSPNISRDAELRNALTDRSNPTRPIADEEPPDAPTMQAMPSVVFESEPTRFPLWRWGVAGIVLIALMAGVAWQWRRAAKDSETVTTLSSVVEDGPVVKETAIVIDDSNEDSFASSTGTAVESTSDPSAVETAVTPLPAQFAIGESVTGVPLDAHRFGDGETVVLLIGGLHSGRAPSSVSLLDQLVQRLQEERALIPESVTLLLLPNSNPDSLVSGQRVNANGVDLNRNSACNWLPNPLVRGIQVDGLGGKRPFSEPETEAISTFVLEQSPQLVLIWNAPVSTGWVAAGRCETDSLLSQRHAMTFAEAAGYFYGETLPNQSGIESGDLANWLVSQKIPAATIWLPTTQSADIESNLAGLNAVLQSFLNE